ncbi:methylated-DNA--[protein]-cysteine S-methyltransferase [Aureispira anguillae]|uniref:Methylated-DNA--protein-cysteine methyltransferase n=1 Tax=Aureispira anguillae TaxID=2864201 RepID=A0A915YJD3_9BACT|nr:methylated-DNA--[protein]-cysteine S-methyltransferase [Aureispira anguillae]BDS14278.1 methylated-DNA--[protein]-cysteine S-methyltransferase [Aureispira anguillae]
MKTYYNSPIGRFVITGSMQKITSIRIDDTVQNFSGQLAPYMMQCVKELDAYFNEGLEQFSVELDLSQGTKFQQQVWNELLNIPYGRTSTYLKIAEKVSSKRAVRAVGRCVGNNPFAIIAPCHRVIGTDGSLTGFAYGLEAKRLLLELEKSKLYGKQNKLF